MEKECGGSLELSARYIYKVSAHTPFNDQVLQQSGDTVVANPSLTRIGFARSPIRSALPDCLSPPCSIVSFSIERRARPLPVDVMAQPPSGTKGLSDSWSNMASNLEDTVPVPRFSVFRRWSMPHRSRHFAKKKKKKPKWKWRRALSDCLTELGGHTAQFAQSPDEIEGFLCCCSDRAR